MLKVDIQLKTSNKFIETIFLLLPSNVYLPFCKKNSTYECLSSNSNCEYREKCVASWQEIHGIFHDAFFYISTNDDEELFYRIIVLLFLLRINLKILILKIYLIEKLFLSNDSA
jgi:hypothetical protein